MIKINVIRFIIIYMTKTETRFYTRDELNELEEWFNGRELPEDIQLDKATYIPNVKETLKKLIVQAEINCDNPKMQGAIYLLERLKKKLEETQN